MILAFIVLCAISAVLLSFPAHAAVPAKQFLFRQFTTNDGLPSNSVLSIAQDYSGIIWVGTRNGLCWFDGERFNPPDIEEDLAGLLSGHINSIHPGPAGELWIATGKGICLYYPLTGAFRPLDRIPHNARDPWWDKDGCLWFISSGVIWRMAPGEEEAVAFSGTESIQAVHSCVDTAGQFWFAARDGNLYRFLPESNSFESFRILPEQVVAAGVYPTQITPLADGDFLVATNNNAIHRVNPLRDLTELLSSPDELKDGARILCMMENNKEEYLIGSNKGLYLLNGRTRSINEIASYPTDRLSISSDNIRSLFKDNSGRIWIGTFYSGINLRLQSEITFYRNFSEHSPYSIRGNTVRGICTDEANHIWIGTEDGFLNRINPDGTVLPLGSENGLPPETNFHALLMHRGQLVIATYDNGILLFDPVRLRVTARYDLPATHFICLLESRDGDLLAGANNGLYVFRPEEDCFERIEQAGNRFVHALCESSDGRILLGTYGSGVWILDRSAGTYTPMETDSDHFGSDRLFITHLYEDPSGTLWIATEGDGLCRVRKSADAAGSYEIIRYTSADGLPSNVICAIIQGREGRLWVSTDKGLFSFDPQMGRITGSYFDKNNTVGNYFRYGSALIDSSGRILMGSTQGMIAFRPSSLSKRNEPVLMFSEILAGCYDRTLRLRESGHSVLSSSRIRVRQRDAAFLTFRFANIAADDWQHRRYRYSFSHHKTRIESVSEDNSVTFAGIRPGLYDFELSVDGSDAPGSRRKLEIRVVPPIYASAGAILFYLLVLLGLAGWMLHNYFRRRQQAREQHLQHLEEQKQHEIYDAKINFFTNIAHEIRTPLTLIKMPVDKLIEEQRIGWDARQDLETVKTNTDRLLDLTNQLLDFRKIESKQLQLSFLEEDLCERTRRVCSCYEHAARENHIRFCAMIPQESIRIMCAAASIEKILNNLISNGLKYCQSSVTLHLSESSDGKGAVLRVTSDGEKISPIHRERIFEPFFQERPSQIWITGSKGTGLGLPFAKILTELHNGRLFLDDSDTPGNCFILTLPKEQDQPIELHRPQAESGEAEILSEGLVESFTGQRHTVLIAEDDAELNHYLRKEIGTDYHVLQAFNGDEALELIKTQKVDILVSDIMMPGINGCALCNIIKTNLEYSHIPVLLLTAAVGMERHIETLQVGADGYLEKPFPISLLKANIQNLFNNRELTFKQFTNSPLSHFNGLKVGNMDDDYMNRLHQEVMKQLSNPNLGIDDLVSRLGTSRSTLFRKVKANTGLNINEYIKLCRLKKAAELLAEQKYKIGEVVYRVGFSSASYFTANFKRQFNISPSDFVRQIKGNADSGKLAEK